MASPVEVQLILCDAAQADSQTGKVSMLGAGWSMTSSPTAPQAVAVLMKIPWDRTNQRLAMKIELLDADGHPVQIKTPESAQPIHVDSYVEAGRPPGIPAGSMLDASFVLNIPSLPLSPGRYEWKLLLADQRFSASFTVLANRP